MNGVSVHVEIDTEPWPDTVAQLGRASSGDPKVPGPIPGRGT